MFQMMQAAKFIPLWNSSGLEFINTFERAPSNHGIVDLMQSLSNSSFVAVKRMPNRWMSMDSQEFQKQQPYCLENPWRDIAAVRYLKSQHLPYICKNHGVFRDNEFTYVVSDFAEKGSLFELCKLVRFQVSNERQP